MAKYIAPFLFFFAVLSLTGCSDSSKPEGDIEPPVVEVQMSIEEIDLDCPYYFRLRADPRGSSDNESDASELQIRWDFFNDGEWDNDYSDLDLKLYQYIEPPLDDVWNLRCEIQDAAGNSSIWTGSLDFPVEDWPVSPDIIASSITIYPQGSLSTSVDTMIVGQGYGFRASRRDWMPASHLPYDVAFYIDDILVFTATTVGLSGLDSCRGIGWPISSEFMTVGTHELLVVFDSDDAVEETNEGNNAVHRSAVVVE